MLGSLFLGPLVFAAFGLLLVVVGLLEFYRLVKSTELSPNIPAGLILSLAVYGLAFSVLVYNKSLQNALLLVPIVLAVFVAELYRKSSTPFQNIAITLLAVLWVPVSHIFYRYLFYYSYGPTIQVPICLGLPSVKTDFLSVTHPKNRGKDLWGVSLLQALWLGF
jgi:phosphatidate cytidylyltransferase